MKMAKIGNNVHWIAIILLGVAANASAQRYPIGAGQVASALNGAGYQVLREQIVLPAPIQAGTPAPALRIRTVQAMPDHSTLIRLECATATECLPFYVKIRTDRDGGQTPASKQIAQLIPAVADTGAAQRPTVVHAGSPATLQLDGTHIHIRIPVVCIESGKFGQTVRARGADNRQIYTAEVVSATLLKGTL